MARRVRLIATEFTGGCAHLSTKSAPFHGSEGWAIISFGSTSVSWQRFRRRVAFSSEMATSMHACRCAEQKTPHPATAILLVSVCMAVLASLVRCGLARAGAAAYRAGSQSTRALIRNRRVPVLYCTWLQARTICAVYVAESSWSCSDTKEAQVMDRQVVWTLEARNDSKNVR